MKLLIPLFSPPTGTWGGLTRGLAFAEAAQRAGHEVAFCACGYMAQRVRQRGYKVYPTPATTMLGLPPRLSRVMERRSQHVSPPVQPGRSVGSIWLVLLFVGMARPRYLRRLVAAQLAAVKERLGQRIRTYGGALAAVQALEAWAAQ